MSSSGGKTKRSLACVIIGVGKQILSQIMSEEFQDR